MPWAPRTRRTPSPRRSRKPDSQSRPNANARGYTWAWNQYTHAYRRRHPLCVACLAIGLTTAAECVDHITPVSGPDDPLFWEESNHQSLCWSCHSKKTVQDTKNGKTR